MDGEQGLYKEIHRRFVHAGEWDRILGIFVQKLNESGWMDEMRHRGKETAQNLDSLKFSALLEHLEPHAQASVPLAIKKEIMDQLTQFLEKQFDE